MLALILLIIWYFIDPSYTTFFWAIMIASIISNFLNGYFGYLLIDVIGTWIVCPIIWEWVNPESIFSFVGIGAIIPFITLAVHFGINIILAIFYKTFYRK